MSCQAKLPDVLAAFNHWSLGPISIRPDAAQEGDVRPDAEPQKEALIPEEYRSNRCRDDLMMFRGLVNDDYSTYDIDFYGFHVSWLCVANNDPKASVFGILLWHTQVE